MRARRRSRASGQREADCREYGFSKERGDSDNIAAFQAILSDVVCGVGGWVGCVVMACGRARRLGVVLSEATREAATLDLA
jgi:hypothetical protein